jgi:Ricin-type beta-trefoil lectin domain
VSLVTRFRAFSSRRRGLTAGAAILGTTALTVGLTVAPASAGSTYQQTGTWQDYQTGLCLDGNSSGAVYTNPCNGDAYQKWGVWLTTDNTNNFQSQQTGLCLDSNYAGAVYADACNSNDTYQGWTEGGEGPGVTIQDFQTGLCLDSNYAYAVYADACNWNDTYQNWEYFMAS